MRDAPILDDERLIDLLRTDYRIHVTTIRFLPLGNDLDAFAFEGIDADGTAYFLKVRRGSSPPPGLRIPHLLREHGISNILAPLPTASGELWSAFDGHTVTVLPFVRGENAKKVGLTDDQWRTFGATLGSIHSGDFTALLQGTLPAETFAIPSAARVRHVYHHIQTATLTGPAARAMAAFFSENAAEIEQILIRAETLGNRLRSRSFEFVLWQWAIPGGNILVADDGGIFLVDWDGPLLAPRERDLLFVVGSPIARRVTPHDEAVFFEGYGEWQVDRTALAYYRYERAIEDIGECAHRVFFEATLSEGAREREAILVRGLFQPGDIIDAARNADPHR